MNILKLATAAAIALSSLSVPAMAQDDHHGDRDRGDRGDRWERHDNGRHNGWRNHRRHRVCHWVVRHHHRYRVCTWRRW
jgi:hypothetical protein